MKLACFPEMALTRPGPVAYEILARVRIMEGDVIGRVIPPPLLLLLLYTLVWHCFRASDAVARSAEKLRAYNQRRVVVAAAAAAAAAVVVVVAVVVAAAAAAAEVCACVCACVCVGWGVSLSLGTYLVALRKHRFNCFPLLQCIHKKFVLFLTFVARLQSHVLFTGCLRLFLAVTNSEVASLA
jgi:hypothetical protein